MSSAARPGSELGAGPLSDCGNGLGLADPGDSAVAIVAGGSEPPPGPLCAWVVVLPLEATATSKTNTLNTFNKMDLNENRCNILVLSFRSLYCNV